MRRLKRDDGGATIIFVTLGLAAMLLMASLALDVGSMFFNKARAQNSADARALAAAVNCAQGKAINTVLPALKPEETVAPPDGLDIGSCSGHNQVTATVSQPQDFQFMPISHTVTHTATAKWGTISGGDVLPITIASCEFSQSLLDGTDDITLYLDDPKPQSGCSSLPGGFSQLDRASDTQCSIELNADGTVNGKPGGDLKKMIPCITPMPKDLLVPIYDVSAVSRANHDNGQGPYPILGFAEFHLTGYSFNGNASAGTLGRDCPMRPALGETQQNQVPKYCIRGDFVRMLAPGDTMPGPSQDFGVTKVYLTS
jgi:hypothetical protein